VSAVANPADHFERLGLPRRFSLDPAEVERQYLARSRAVHPDFHQESSGGERRASLELSAALNESYAVLKDPFRRAEHLLALLGGPSASDHKQMDPMFLAEMLELREEIEELRQSAGDRAGMESQLAGRRAALFGEVGEHFAKAAGLSEDDPGRAQLLTKVRQRLNALKYVQGLLRDLRAD